MVKRPAAVPCPTGDVPGERAHFVRRERVTKPAILFAAVLEDCRLHASTVLGFDCTYAHVRIAWNRVMCRCPIRVSSRLRWIGASTAGCRRC